MAKDDDGSTKKTLTDDEIVTEGRDFGRRKAVGLVGAGAAVLLATGCRRRVVAARTVVVGGLTDHDQGPCADPGGQGRGTSGLTDNDGGGCADPGGRGRGGGRVVQVQQQGTGVTDADTGYGSDAVGYGRGGRGYSTGITDSDRGPCADPGGGGRGYSGMTDSDSGHCSDPGGRGRSGY